MMRDEHSTHWWWQISSFVPAREPEYTPRLLLSSTPWFSAILGQSGAPGSRTRGEVAALGRLDIFRTTKEPHSCVTGAPTTLRPRVSRGAPRTAAGDALRLTCWSGPRPARAGPSTSGMRGARAHALLPPRAGHGRL